MPCKQLWTSSAPRTTPALTKTTRRGTRQYRFCSRPGWREAPGIFRIYSCAQFESTLDMPSCVRAPAIKLVPESPIVDLTGLEDPEPRAPQPGIKDLLVLAAGTHGPRDAGNAPKGAPPLLNGFLTWLNAVDDTRVGSLVWAFYFTMQIAGCEIPSFPHDSLRHH